MCSHFFWAIHEPRLNTVRFVVHCALHHIASNSSSSSLCSCDIGCSVPGNCCADYADECSAESQYPVKLELSSETQFVAALGSDRVPQAAGLVASVTGKMMQRITEHNTPKLVTTPYSGEVSTIVCTADNCEEGTTFNMSGHGKLHRVKESLTSTVIGGTTLSMGEIEKQNLPMIMDAFFTLWLDPQWISPALFNIAYGLHFMHMENPWSHLPVTPMYVEKWFRSMHGFSLSTEQSHYGVGITGGMLDDTQPENNYEFGVRYFGGKLRASDEVVDFSSVGLSQDWKQFVDVIVVDIVRENRTTTTTTTMTNFCSCGARFEDGIFWPPVSCSQSVTKGCPTGLCNVSFGSSVLCMCAIVFSPMITIMIFALIVRDCVFSFSRERVPNISETIVLSSQSFLRLKNASV